MKVVDIGLSEKPLMTNNQLKEAITAFTYMAEMNWSYFQALKTQGFSEQQAIEIVKSYKFV